MAVLRRVGTGTGTLPDHAKSRLAALSILLLFAVGVAGCAPDRTPTDDEATSKSAAVSPAESTAASTPGISAVVPDETVDKAAQWIVDTWESDPVSFGDIENLSDTVIALSASERFPNTVTTMLQQLQANGQGLLEEDELHPVELAKIIIAADVTNQDPRDFLGCDSDPVQQLRSLLGSEGGRVAVVEGGNPFLVAVALHRGGESIPTWLVDEMLTRQDGGFRQAFGQSKQDVDPVTTALGISAMNDVMGNTRDAQERKKAKDSLAAAIAWAEDPANQQPDDSGDGIFWSDDIMATGMMTAALGDVRSAGTLPGAEPDVDAPTRYLRAQQLPDGGWPGLPDGEDSDIAATIHSLLGVVGAGYGSAHTSGIDRMMDCPDRPTARPSTSGNLPTASQEPRREN